MMKLLPERATYRAPPPFPRGPFSPGVIRDVAPHICPWCGGPNAVAASCYGAQYQLRAERWHLVMAQPCHKHSPSQAEVECPRCKGVDAHLPTCGV